MFYVVAITVVLGIACGSTHATFADEMISIHSRLSCPAESVSGEQPAAWGHIYIPGQLEPIEHFTAARSGNLPCRAHKLEQAEPNTLCSQPSNSQALNGSIVIIQRGECSFGTKVLNAHRAGSVAAIIVNTENNLFSLPYDLDWDETKEVANLPAVLVRPRAGIILERYLQQMKQIGEPAIAKLVGEYQPNIVLDSSIVPCGKCQQRDAEPPVQATEAHNLGVNDIVTGGVLTVFPHGEKDALEFEFLTGEFGSPLLLNRMLTLVQAEPLNGCEPLKNANRLDGQVVFVQRGGCPFVTKLENALQAGSRVVLFGNTPSIPITNPGVTPEQMRIRTDGFSHGTLQSSVIVSHIASEQIQSKLADATNGTIGIQFASGIVDIEHFEPIRQLYDMEYWSPIEDVRKEQLEQMLSANKLCTTGERRAVVQELYHMANDHYSGSAHTQGLPVN